MKNAIVIALLALSFNSFANVAEILVDESVEQLLSTEEVNEAKMQNQCHGATPCPNGAHISCQSYGMGCSWYVQPYSYVTCTGYNAYGQWATATFTCY